MIQRLYAWFHRITSRPGEAGEYSAGHWADKVRMAALHLCEGRHGRLLEIGCGEGLFLSQLAGRQGSLEMWGVDNDEARLSRASARVPRVNLSRQDASKLSFEDGHFDTVVCVNVLFNLASIEDVRKILSEAARVCKRSGRIIFDFRNSRNPFMSIKYKLARYYDATVKNLPLNTYSLKEIEAILSSANLKVVKTRYVGASIPRYAPCVVVEAEKI